MVAKYSRPHMALIRNLAELNPGPPAVMTIGVFDGVHRGHQALISQVVERARALQGQSIVLTFYPHPRAVLRPGKPVYELTSQDEKLALIAALGADVVTTVTFTRELSLLTAAQFIDLLLQHVHLRELWVGPDFALGHNREGTVERLSQLGTEHHFAVDVVEPVDSAGERVSSSRIRDLVTAGDVEQAATLLGRYPHIEGVVVTGVRRGQTLGFPTANLALTAAYLLPADGIYAVFAELDGARLPAVASIGVRPTFGINDRLVEVYLFDFARDIYGQHLGVSLVKRLRNEERFDSVDDLIAQMQRDASEAREVLANVEESSPFSATKL
jgi:riboflavin kinase/FMN adenylyltransferase